VPRGRERSDRPRPPLLPERPGGRKSRRASPWRARISRPLLLVGEPPGSPPPGRIASRRSSPWFGGASKRRLTPGRQRPKRCLPRSEPLKQRLLPQEGVTNIWTSNSNRRAELPPNWESLRTQVLRDSNYECRMGWQGCLTRATEVDHIRRGNDHSISNLRAACSACHSKKSSREGLAQRRALQARRKRPPERHPGTT